MFRTETILNNPVLSKETAMIIRPMTTEDVPAVHTMGATERAFAVCGTRCFYTRKQLCDCIHYEENLMLVAEQNNNVVGFSISVVPRGTQEAKWDIFVSPEARPTGVAVDLAEDTMKRLHAKGVTLVYSLANADNPAVPFFEALGLAKGYQLQWFSKRL